jgi:hypothetical protein
MTAPLEDVLHHAAQMAEQMFDKDGRIDPLWLIETAEGERHMVTTPHPPGMSSQEFMSALWEMMFGVVFKKLGMVRYARAASVVVVDDEPVIAPLRYEIALEADDGCEILRAVREIIWPPSGKPYLAKMSAIARFEEPPVEPTNGPLQ